MVSLNNKNIMFGKQASETFLRQEYSKLEFTHNVMDISEAINFAKAESANIYTAHQWADIIKAHIVQLDYIINNNLVTKLMENVQLNKHTLTKFKDDLSKKLGTILAVEDNTQRLSLDKYNSLFENDRDAIIRKAYESYLNDGNPIIPNFSPDKTPYVAKVITPKMTGNSTLIDNHAINEFAKDHNIDLSDVDLNLDFAPDFRIDDKVNYSLISKNMLSHGIAFVVFIFPTLGKMSISLMNGAFWNIHNNDVFLSLNTIIPDINLPKVKFFNGSNFITKTLSNNSQYNTQFLAYYELQVIRAELIKRQQTETSKVDFKLKRKHKGHDKVIVNSFALPVASDPIYEKLLPIEQLMSHNNIDPKSIRKRLSTRTDRLLKSTKNLVFPIVVKTQKVIHSKKTKSVEGKIVNLYSLPHQDDSTYSKHAAKYFAKAKIKAASNIEFDNLSNYHDFFTAISKTSENPAQAYFTLFKDVMVDNLKFTLSSGLTITAPSVAIKNIYTPSKDKEEYREKIVAAFHSILVYSAKQIIKKTKTTYFDYIHENKIKNTNVSKFNITSYDMHKALSEVPKLNGLLPLNGSLIQSDKSSTYNSFIYKTSKGFKSFVNVTNLFFDQLLLDNINLYLTNLSSVLSSLNIKFNSKQDMVEFFKKRIEEIAPSTKSNITSITKGTIGKVLTKGIIDTVKQLLSVDTVINNSDYTYNPSLSLKSNLIKFRTTLQKLAKTNEPKLIFNYFKFSPLVKIMSYVVTSGNFINNMKSVNDLIANIDSTILLINQNKIKWDSIHTKLIKHEFESHPFFMKQYDHLFVYGKIKKNLDDTYNVITHVDKPVTQDVTTKYSITSTIVQRSLYKELKYSKTENTSKHAYAAAQNLLSKSKINYHYNSETNMSEGQILVKVPTAKFITVEALVNYNYSQLKEFSKAIAEQTNDTSISNLIINIYTYIYNHSLILAKNADFELFIKTIKNELKNSYLNTDRKYIKALKKQDKIKLNQFNAKLKITKHLKEMGSTLINTVKAPVSFNTSLTDGNSTISATANSKFLNYTKSKYGLPELLNLRSNSIAYNIQSIQNSISKLN